jgi:hypothetical protein
MRERGIEMAGVMNKRKIKDIKAYLKQTPQNTIPFERSDKTFLLKELRYDGKAITVDNETLTLTFEELERCWKYATK